MQLWNPLTMFLTWLGSNWLLALPLALGFVAVWWLLPQPRRRDGRLAAAFGAAALVLGGLALLESTGRAEGALFYVFSGLAVVSGVCMITQRNPVYTALWFALVILSTCGLFLLQSALFLAAATIIVYAGAIIVTFLFVIMLAQQSGLADYDRRAREPLLACLAGFVLLTALIYVLQVTYSGQAYPVEDSRLTQVKSRLRALHGLIAAQAPIPEIEAAMWPEPHMSLGDGLREELKKLPGSRSRLATVDRLLLELAAARQQNDRDVLGKTVGELQAIADANPTSNLSGGKARHVTALGMSLFGDYLWAVELAGTLLLVATVGAIAIAQRRREVVS